MDLGAYININDETYVKIIKENNIDVPRLRGYRWMGNELPVPDEDYKREEEFIKKHIYRDAIHACPTWNLNTCCHEYSSWKKYLEKYYGVFKDGEMVDLQWKKINRKKRKAIKLAIKKALSCLKKQNDTFNKYCGREDVLYIHARIGGNNWIYYEGYKLEKEPWFLEKVDDYFDNTYCDIYAKIKPYNFTEFYTQM